ncbi:FAD-dependent oxidoreductase [Sporotomaculum syntrophicum]|nr:FAD-dependent oxidoreductase [Sporotomaculum syntrophicum]
MVVGAGIAGIQTSLDLADSGYYVYLVEQSPAIGGIMPALDKTFPTNDCSMCILSPKIVECGRHLNIEKHMLTSIVDIQGEPGNFKVTLHKKARFVDLNKCTACGDCAMACPVEVPNNFNAYLENRQAIYKTYPQAMPAAYAIEKAGIPPCRAACPAGVNVQGYVQLIKKGDFLGAWSLIYQDNPFPAVCGLVCAHPCENRCYRGRLDTPVSIKNLKLVAAEQVYAGNLDELPLPAKATERGQKVAIIGSGPAGLTAAYHLVKRGYRAVVFESERRPGGMMRKSIPEYRLPRHYLDTEIHLLKKLGVEIRCKHRWGTDFSVTGLKKEFDAVFIAVKTPKSSQLGTPGKELAKVMHHYIYLSADDQVLLNDDGRLQIDHYTLETSLEGVFAGGDNVTGPRNVISGIGVGKRAAESIDRYLNDIEQRKDRIFKVSVNKIAPPGKPVVTGVTQNTPASLPFSPVEPSEQGFAKETTRLTPEQAIAEAGRCLNCGICSECGACEKTCLSQAINLHATDAYLELQVGAIILCPGVQAYDPSHLLYLGYGNYPNVVTSVEFERILSASGPYQGHLLRPFDHRVPRNIAWIQCVGSRNNRESHGYCSSVCCMSAIKEAVIAKEHSEQPLAATVFMMDMRCYGKDFEKYYRRAEQEYGVKFVRSRIYQIEQVNRPDKNLLIRYQDENDKFLSEEFDLVVLSVGLEPSIEARGLTVKTAVAVNRYGFVQLAPFTGVNTSRPGIFTAGAFNAPKDIPETVQQASAAACAAGSLLSEVRGTLVKKRAFPVERDVSGEIPRIGVFICRCGSNIGGVVRVPEVVAEAQRLPYVVYAEDELYACSQGTHAKIRAAIQEHNLNRVVVASCSPRTHQLLFQETLQEAGLNKFLFAMANIRDQCSWVHMHEPERATVKAIDLTRMAVYKAALLQPLGQVSIGITKSALVIGGGVTGMVSALALAEMCYPVSLVEKSSELGGMGKRLKLGFAGENVEAFVNSLIKKVEQHPLIKVYKSVKPAEATGYAGNFTTILTSGTTIKHGVTIVAIGGQEYQPNEYLYGQSNRVMTLLEMEEVMNRGGLKNAHNVVLINCVGSRDNERPYCSRICCSKSINLAIRCKENNSAANVFVLYRDVRTYGFLEDCYLEARVKGVIFVRYDEEHKPQVVKNSQGIIVTIRDHILGRNIIINADVVGLAAAILPPEDNILLSRLLKLPLNADGFFLEAHMKLRPVDFTSEGIFMAGIAHGPKNLEENIAQAKAAAGRAATILSKESLASLGLVATVDPNKCAACLTCVRLCPFHVPRISFSVAEIEPVLCQGCGICAGECPNKAITLQGCSEQMLNHMLNGLCEPGDALQ